MEKIEIDGINYQRVKQDNGIYYFIDSKDGSLIPVNCPTAKYKIDVAIEKG